MSINLIKELREMTNAPILDCQKALKETNGDVNAAADFLRKKGLASAAKKSGRTASYGLVAVNCEKEHGYILELNCETDFVAKVDSFQKLAKDLTVLSKDYTDVESMLAGTMGEHTVKDEISHAIAVIGENIVLRRIGSLTGSYVGSYVHNAICPNMGSIAVLVSFTITEGDIDHNILSTFCKDIAMHIAASNTQYKDVSDVPASVIEHELSILKAQLQDSGKPQQIIEKMISGRLEKFYEQVVLFKQPFVKDDKKNIQQVVEEFAVKHGAKLILSGYIKYVLGEGIEKVESNFADEVAAATSGVKA